MLSFKNFDEVSYVISKKKINTILIILGSIHLIAFGFGIFHFMNNVEYETKISNKKLEGYECTNLSPITMDLHYNFGILDKLPTDMDLINYYEDDYYYSYPRIMGYIHESEYMTWGNCYSESYEMCKTDMKQTCKSIISDTSNFFIRDHTYTLREYGEDVVRQDQFCGLFDTDFNNCWGSKYTSQMWIVEGNDINKCKNDFEDFCEDILPELYCQPWLEEIPPYSCSRTRKTDILSAVGQSFAVIEMSYCFLIIVIASYYKYKYKKNQTVEENVYETEV